MHKSLGPALVLLLALGARLHAQAPFDACTDRLGAPVPSQTNDTMDAAGMAGYAGNTQPTIWWNSRRLEKTSRVEQLFIYLHECAHLRLNHPWKAVSIDNEIEADCWAAQLMVEGGMISPAEWDSLLVARARVIPDSNHLGGGTHAASLVHCLEVRTDPAAWEAVLPLFIAAADSQFTGIRGLELEAPAGQEGQVWESNLDLPGTYNCEVFGTEQLRCMVYTSRHARAVANRYKMLVGIISAWLPDGWVSAEDVVPELPFDAAFHAHDPETGVSLSLLLAVEPRLFFVMRAAE